MVKQSTESIRSASVLAAQQQLAEIQPGQLTVFTEIAQGRFKTVSSGCHCRHGKVAVLHYNSDKDKNEAHILGLVSKHGAYLAHIPQVFGTSRDKSCFKLAQELSMFGSVRAVLREQELSSLVTLDHKLQMAAQFAEAASFLESLRIVHADLACRNFLVFQLDEDATATNVKLTDFMVALCLPANSDQMVKKMPMATRWCAPETVAGSTWSSKTDVWSLGATLWELFADGLVPWTSYTRRGDVSRKLQELAESLPSLTDLSEDFPMPESGMCPADVRTALMSCLQPNPRARPSSKQIASTLKQIVKPSPDDMEVESCPALASPAQEPTSPQKIISVRSNAQDSQQGSVGRAPALPAVSAPAALTSVPVEVLEPSSSDAKMSRCMQTPPTRCPSTPESGSAKSWSGYLLPCSLVFHDDASTNSSHLPHATVQASETKPLSHLTLHQLETCKNIKALWSSPDAPQTRENVESMRAFLSSPEAVCGLSPEKLVFLRQRLSDAEACRKSSSSSYSRSMPTYDTIVPLVPLSTAWHSHPVRRGFRNQ